MNQRQLKSLISAGIFSTALLSGMCYADDAPADANAKTNSVPASCPAPMSDGVVKTGATPPGSPSADAAASPDLKKATSDKSAASHGCGGAGGCGSDKGDGK